MLIAKLIVAIILLLLLLRVLSNHARVSFLVALVLVLAIATMAALAPAGHA